MFEYKGKEINTMAEVRINDKRYFLLSLSDNKDSRQREWAEMFLPVAEAERFLALPDETTVVREQIPPAHPRSAVRGSERSSRRRNLERRRSLRITGYSISSSPPPTGGSFLLHR